MPDIFDMIASKVNKGIAAVSESSKVIVKKTRLNSDISRFENERKQLLQQLGQVIYDMKKDGAPIADNDTISGIVTELDSRIVLAAKLQEQLRRLGDPPQIIEDAMPPCSCGKTNPLGVKFCGECGSKI